MEENLEETVQPDQQPQLIVSEDMRSYIYDMTKWTSFLAIVGFVLTGLMVLTAFTIGPAISTDAKLAAAMAASSLSPMGITLFCLVFAFAIFYPSLLLYKYTAKAKLGVLYGEQASLNEAFGKMKSLFKYWGIITLIGIVFYILLIVLSVIAQASR